MSHAILLCGRSNMGGIPTSPVPVHAAGIRPPEIKSRTQPAQLRIPSLPTVNFAV